MMRSHLCSWLLLVLSITGCAASTNGAARPQSGTASAPVETAPVTVIVPVAAVAIEPAPSRPPGPLTRGEIEALVRGGLGVLLGRVEVTPVMAAGRFVGFRLDAAQDLDAWHAAGADIRLGDVIVRVNGVRVERPEQAQWAFERLRIAQAIEVDLLREGAPTHIRAPIVDTHAGLTPRS